MSNNLRHSIAPGPIFTGGVLLALMAGIFVVDTATNYGIAAAVFYTAVILVAARLLPRRTVIALAVGSVILTIASFVFTRSGAYEVGLVNTAFSIIAIGIAAYLGLKLVSAEADAHQARERLLRIARVTTLGQLTASIAHEVSQPLAAISNSSSACGRWLAQDPPNIEKARAALARIAADTARASEILSRVRGMARGEAPKQSLFAFNEAVLEIVDLSRREIERYGIALKMQLQDDMAPALADKVQIQQVMGNLILNAIEIVSTHSGSRQIEIRSSQTEPDKILFTIADSGTGLSAAARNHLFDAFWTTKEGGFGLGLTISRSIVEANGGHIWTVPGSLGGATFLFDVPAGKEPRP